MSPLMSLPPASGEFLSEFPSPRVILSFFPHPWPYRLLWPCQELKLPPASLSVSWVVLGPLTTSRRQPFRRGEISIVLFLKQFSEGEIKLLPCSGCINCRCHHLSALGHSVRNKCLCSCYRWSIARAWFQPAAGNSCESSFRGSSGPPSRALLHSICK
jgi:hypothetical protein